MTSVLETVQGLLLTGFYGLVMLGVLIFVHELGHFLLAKFNGVGVLEFAIGFGRKIWQKRIGETRYSIGIIPLGGYVRMVGDDPRDLDSAGELKEAKAEVVEDAEADQADKSVDSFVFQSVGDEDSEEVKALMQDRSRWFLEKGYFAKFSIVIAGPGFNLLFAWILAITTFCVYGQSIPTEEPVIGETVPEHPAEKAGLRQGDRVMAIDGQAVKTFRDLATVVRNSEGREMQFLIQRPEGDGDVEELTVPITGMKRDEELATLKGEDLAKPYYLIGIQPLEDQRVPVSFSDAVKFGTYHVGYMTSLAFRSFVLMVTGRISPKNIAGPISIVQLASKHAERGLENFFSFMIFISISLAVLNLLPIPILDGGHLMFFTIEALKGRPLSMRVQDIANQVGIVILLALMLFALGNDLFRHTGLGSP